MIGNYEQYFGPYLQNIGNLIRSNRQVRSLEIHSTFGGSISTVLDMIKDHSLITKLHIVFSGRVTNQRNLVIRQSEINRIVSKHSSLVELNLQSYIFIKDEVIEIIDQLKSLKRFEFSLQDGYEVTQLKSNLDPNEWTLTYRCRQMLCRVKLERKN